MTPFSCISSLDETRRIFGVASLSLTYPFYKVDKCRDTVTSYFRDEEQLRKLGTQLNLRP
jgi:hypothetical protein